MSMWIIWWSQKLETNQASLQATFLVAPSACDFNANGNEPESCNPNFQSSALHLELGNSMPREKWLDLSKVWRGAATEWKGALNQTP